MKEFGFYTVNQSYINKMLLVDPSIAGLKGSIRPSICVKDNNGRNWLIPIASLDPNDPNYPKKLSKYKDFLTIDKQQAKDDNNELLRAINIFNDLTGLKTDSRFRSIVEYYNAIPVKHKYCKKYRDRNHSHIVLADPKLRIRIKKSFRLNLGERIKGKQVGFIKYKINHNNTFFETYPKKCIEIQSELYKEHTERLKKNIERKTIGRQRAEEKQEKKELRQTVRQQAVASNAQPMSREQQIKALISVCKQRIASEIERDQTRAIQAQQVEQVQQERRSVAKATDKKTNGKAPRGK